MTTKVRCLLIVIKALPTLLSEPLCVNHAFQEDARTVLGVARVPMERLLNRQAGIKADAATQGSSSEMWF